jgi:hypothetical protein
LGAKDVSPDIVVEGIDQIDPHTSGDYEVTYTITKEETINGKKELKTLEEVRVVRVKANENDPVPPPPLPPVKDNENDPVPPPPPPPVEDFEISAVLDDVTASVEDSIAREVENQLKDERNNMSRLNPKKFIRVFNRGAKRKKMIKKALADRKDR